MFIIACIHIYKFETYFLRQVICGEAFGFQVTYELGSFMYMYMLGNVAVLAWKCE